jgi:hypothetical protein
MIWKFRKSNRSKTPTHIVSKGDPETFLGEFEGDLHTVFIEMAINFKPGDILETPEGFMWCEKPHGDPRN